MADLMPITAIPGAAITLRPYQSAMVEGFRAAYAGGRRRVLGVLPTGGGKGRLLAHVAAGTAAKGKTIVVMAHRAELVDQICANLDDEGVPYGRIQPGWPMLRYRVLVGMVQTIVRRLSKLPVPDLLLIDEAHHAPAGQYVAITTAWPQARMLGVTATPSRSDGQGLGQYFDVMVQGPSMADLIQAKHLADYEYYLPSPDFDMAGAGSAMGDFKAADALKIMAKAKIVGDAVQHYQTHLGRRPAIAFCMGVQHCEDTAAEFRAAGLRSAHVDGKMDMTLRRERLAGLANGLIDVLTAADVISEGVDIPAIAGAILLRPTQSVGLHLQQVGRALRLKPDGSRAVILDHVNNARLHGFPADPRKWTLDHSPKPDAPALRNCETCFRAFPAGEARAIALTECRREACPMQVVKPDAEMQEPPLRTAGMLERASDPWAWAGGIDPLRAAGPEWRALIARAQTEEQLRMISRARGFKRGWTTHVLRDRQQGAAA